MKDVADAAGVSVMTVSRAFRRDGTVSAETKAKILRAADALGYVFDANASTLRSQRTGFVAVIIPTIDNPNFADTLGALSAGLETQGLQMLLAYSNYNMEEEERLLALLLQRKPEAIVVTGGHHTARARRLLQNAGIPVVEVWDLPPDPIDHVVGFSNAATMDALVDHLVASGRRKIGFIGGDYSGDTRGADRRRGFALAMERHGLPALRLPSVGTPPITMRDGAAGLARLLEAYPDTDAVIGVSDGAAFGALTEAQRRGLRVPDDIAVAGFGGYDISEMAIPAFTTVDPLPRAIGTATADLITAVLRGDAPPNGPQRVEISPKLRLRASTTPR
ncbi:MAG: LacI family DNA-binding transcriptional regulator [Pseudomonadota bacterium]